ncbi:DNA repair protein RecO [Novimethylophilus kurashikiensis]|uniref:DNA repair protein RecO n=1 Tax=Novimethylophilus kurashikiensis TaxID=1825523 RepID=A0A2R5FC71_9PROT|nr:DNA repair protein RecO [Novimethylophilus kurashikiensis]GBG15812.1 DNA repair protein RecO [Novimethylophilus kurashikiensis]
MAVIRQDNKPVYVLHTYPFRETSLVVELFTREFGRISALAKGARRPRAAMRGMLQSFQPLIATWSGKAELKNLHGVEWRGGLHVLHGQALICGFYLNELMLRLLPREDAHEALFEHYEEALRALARDEEQSIVLRRFETRLLQELGYALPLDHEAESATPIEPEQWYCFVLERGPVRLEAGESGVQLLGKTLLDMGLDDYSDPQTQLQSKQLMRALVSHYLGDKPLHTRQLLIDLQQL